jgi:hypothetical protein
VDRRVDEQDHRNSAQDDKPIGNLNASYRRPPAEPFHDSLPFFKRRLRKALAEHSCFNSATSPPRAGAVSYIDIGTHRCRHCLAQQTGLRGTDWHRSDETPSIRLTLRRRVKTVPASNDIKVPWAPHQR